MLRLTIRSMLSLSLRYESCPRTTRMRQAQQGSALRAYDGLVLRACYGRKIVNDLLFLWLFLASSELMGRCAFTF